MEDEKLIEAVKKRAIIYDITSLAYRNAEKKDLTWKEIASEINCDGKCLFIITTIN